MKSLITEEYPLSPLQHGMLLHSLGAPNGGTDIEQIVCTLRESVEVAHLRRAWETIVERHPVFRTAFRFEGSDDPVQVVYEQVQASWQEHDWRASTKQAQAIRLADFLASDRNRGFDMSQAPLLRLTLVRTDEAEYQLIWTFHHALLDGRSFPKILNEAFAFYEASRAGRSLELELPRPYRDYIDWLRLQDPSKAKAYWRELLKGFSNPTPLVVDKAPVAQAQEANRQGDERVTLSEDQTTALNQLAQERGVTLNTLLQAAWALLLSRYSGEEEVVFGAVRACRKSSIEGADEMVGIFINTLPMRICVSPNARTGDWLKEVRRQWVSMRDYEHTPLVEVQKYSDIPAGKPLFESILMFDNYELDQRLRSQGWKWASRSFRLYEQTGYPITLTVYSGTELCLQIEFDRTRFDPPTVTRMLNHLKTLLLGFLAQPQQQLRDIPMLTDRERQQLLVEWNDTRVDYPQDILLHQLFEAQVQRTPEAVAVQFDETRLSYRKLNERSNQLARYLRRMGVGPDTLVGVCMERSLELVVALYAILKAGGAYAPIDPEYPQERVAFMLQDSAPPVLLTQSVIAARLPEHKARVLCVDSHWELIALEDTANLAAVTTPDNLAYMIYTSGSTGRPKGAMNTHRGICNRLLWMQDQYQLTQADTVLQKTPFSFDVSVWEFFWPLLTGARLLVAQPGGHRDPTYLVKLIREHQVTVMHFVPSMLAMFLEEPGVQDCRSLRQVICSGEALPFEVQEQFFRSLSSNLDNLYGPTEAAVDVTYWNCQRESKRKIVPIGRPVANTQVYVLDRNLQPVPIGVPGELYIGGVQVGRGYHNRSELTTERFIPDPFSGVPKALLYKTGDLCRWLPDGNVEYLGRTDFQVKIRGLRVELGEIETIIGENSSVRRCVVVARQDVPGDSKLVAYIVWQADRQGSVADLRAYLQTKLPDYMVPSAFVSLDELPITPNGKVDRRALPPPAIEEQAAENAAQAPLANDAEETIAHIWQDLLGVSRVGRDSNFFDLGGHSLLLIKARNKLERAFAKEVPIVEMFRRPTVRGLAEYLAGGCETEPEPIIRSQEQVAAYKDSARRRLQRRQLRVN